MAEIGFADLIVIYRNTVFDGAGGGVLHVASDAVAETIRTIEADDALYDLTQIALVAPGAVTVGDHVAITIRAPNHRLGLLVRDLDALFNAPDASWNEPPAYYVIDERFARGDAAVPVALARYRSLLTVTAVLREAANYVSDLQRELVFIDDEKTVVPVIFSSADLSEGLVENAARLSRIFGEPLHGDEKTELVSAAVIQSARSIRRADRFRHLISHLDQLCDEVEKGYRLFVSSFSYSKIRKEIETARLEYVGKIHKTLVDIQGQLLGIPVATIVVASQLKTPERCGLAFWTNAGVVLGAWIFVGLLWLAIRNQQHTLTAIEKEINGQNSRLERDYAAVRDDFVAVFDDLGGRITWHRRVLWFVLVLALSGAAGATYAWLRLTPSAYTACL